MSDCIHGLDERWCATCLHGPERDTPWRPAVNDRTGDHVTIPAKHASRCPACGDPIDPGDTIALQRRNEGRPDEEQRWVCAGCA